MRNPSAFCAANEFAISRKAAWLNLPFHERDAQGIRRCIAVLGILLTSRSGKVIEHPKEIAIQICRRELV